LLSGSFGNSNSNDGEVGHSNCHDDEMEESKESGHATPQSENLSLKCCGVHIE
jgi:hypothetical protein